MEIDGTIRNIFPSISTCPNSTVAEVLKVINGAAIETGSPCIPTI